MLGAITIAICCACAAICGLLLGAEAGGADHRLDAELAAGGQVRQRAFGPREVDQHLRRCARPGAQVGGDRARRCCGRGRRAASWPSAGLPATSSAPAERQSRRCSTASISMRPMRPEAPATAMRSGAAPAAGAHARLQRRVVAHRAAPAPRPARLGLRRHRQRLALLLASVPAAAPRAGSEGADRGDELAFATAAPAPRCVFSTVALERARRRCAAAARRPGGGS